MTCSLSSGAMAPNKLYLHSDTGSPMPGFVIGRRA